MQAFDPMDFIAVFQEMLGPVLWLLILLAVAGVGLFVYVLLKEGAIVSARLLRSELVGVVGGFAALVVMAWATVSGFTDAGGPVDWLLIGIIWGAGLVGTTILAYGLQGAIVLGKR